MTYVYNVGPRMELTLGSRKIILRDASDKAVEEDPYQTFLRDGLQRNVLVISAV